MFRSFKINTAKRKNFNGELVQINKSKWGYLRDLKIYGKSTQGANPTLETPQPIKTTGTATNVTACGENLFDMSKLPSGTLSGMTISCNFSDNSIILNGTMTKTDNVGSFFLPTPITAIKETTYRISVEYVSGSITKPAGAYAVAYFGASNTKGSSGNWRDVNLSNNNTSITAVCNYNYITRFWFYLESSVTCEDYKMRIMLQNGVESIPFKPYIGSTTPITFRDTSGFLHDLSSLPDGTSDSVDVYSGAGLDIQKTLIVESGTSPIEVNYYGTDNSTYVMATIFDTTQHYATATNTLNVRSNMFTVIPSNTPARPNILKAYKNPGRFELWIAIPFNEVSSLNSTGVRAWIDNYVLNYGPIIFKYPLATPIPWTLHPDERKKIITVDDTVCNVFTDSEVQPEMEFNAISYGE